MTDFKVPDGAKYLISRIEYLNNKAIKISFADKYNNKEIALPFNVKNISNSLKMLRQR